MGIAGRVELQIGDTVSEDRSIRFQEIPRFAPECFAFFLNPSPARYKQFRKELAFLLAEHLVQVFRLERSTKGPLFGAVGPLQFEVLQYRLREEYGAASTLEMMPWQVLRWLAPAELDCVREIVPYGGRLAQDDAHQPVLLFPDARSLEYVVERHPEVTLLDTQPSGDTHLSVRNGHGDAPGTG